MLHGNCRKLNQNQRWKWNNISSRKTTNKSYKQFVIINRWRFLFVAWRKLVTPGASFQVRLGRGARPSSLPSPSLLSLFSPPIPFPLIPSLSPPPLPSPSPPPTSLPFPFPQRPSPSSPLRSRPRITAKFLGSTLAPPVGPGGARPSNGIWWISG